MDNKHYTIKCECCGQDLKTNIFVPAEMDFKHNYISNDAGTVCFECLGLYMHETYLKNCDTAQTHALINDIKSIKKEKAGTGFEEDIEELPTESRG